MGRPKLKESLKGSHGIFFSAFEDGDLSLGPSWDGWLEDHFFLGKTITLVLG